MDGSISPEARLAGAGAMITEAERMFGRLRVQTVSHALAAPARIYLLHGLMAPGELSVWWGKPKCGKTFLVLRLAYGLALGRGMWGRRARKRVRVLYLAAEGAGGMRNRIRALHDQLGPADNFHFVAQSVDLFDPNADLEALKAAVLELGVELIVVDTLARMIGGGNEDKAQDVGILIRNLDAIREMGMDRGGPGVHVAVLHHGTKHGDASTGPRGSGALVGAADLVVHVSAENGAGRADVTDAKDDPSGNVFGFRLEPVELPPDAEGNPQATCIAEEAEASGAKGRRTLPREKAAWLHAIQDAFAEPGAVEVLSPVPGMKPTPTLTREQLRNDWRVRARLDAEPHKPLTAQQRDKLRDNLNWLSSQRVIGMTDKLVWLL